MLGGSPIIVAVPCRLLLMAMPTSNGTGLIRSLSAKLRAIGATRRTTATFSTDMEIAPASAHKANIALRAVLALSTSHSASTAGTLDSIKNSARTSVPKKRPMTFQLILLKSASPQSSTPVTTRSTPPTHAVQERLLGRITNRT